MNQNQTNFQKLQWLMDYELAGSSRYRRFTSLVMLQSRSEDPMLVPLLSEQIRNSDEMIELESRIAILMGDTDKTDANIALNRIIMRLKDQIDIQYAIVSYPSDGIESSDLINEAIHRIESDEEQ